MKKVISIIAIAFMSSSAMAQSDTLYVYGPGGPLSPMKECAQLFAIKTGIPVKVVGGPESKWLAMAEQNADLIFGGSEYMLTQFDQQHQGLIDSKDRISLYQRRAAILVRPGNPKQIKSIADLAKPGIQILDVNGAGQLGLWEDIVGKQNLIAKIQSHIGQSFANTGLGIEAWKKDSSFDAWITYASWHENLKNETEIVELSSELQTYRGTPIARTLKGAHQTQALSFMKFLQSDPAHKIFKKWGWQ